ncbi:MAG: hypothetical protein KF887_04560 [Paracoccaceae bacterium]|nr:MAG: hypothetical protein KF887_04560 [Paracoccaceae bacterium]
MPNPSNLRRRLPLSLVSAAALLGLPAMAWAAPPSANPFLPPVPEMSCTGPDCAAGEGYFGDAPAHMSVIVEADQGECSECEPEYPEYEYEEESPENPADDPDGASLSDVADMIEAAADHCGTYSIHWRIDCLSSELQAAANRLPSGGDNDVIRAELQRAAAQLAQIANANANPAQSPVRRRTEVDGRTRTTARPIRSVAAARLPAATSAATAVLDNLSTTLLRSAPSAATRRVAFERAAQAVDSSKVLLRSV